MSKHTKGPWFVVEGSIDGIGNCISVSEIQESQLFRPLVCVISHESNLRDEDIPNARLISKAPEMLEMLEKIGSKHYVSLEEINKLIKSATEL